VRVEKAQDAATELAVRLADDRRVRNVRFPSLPGCDPRGLLDRQMRGPGSVMSFELCSEDPAVMRDFLGALEIITPAVSLGSTDSLIQPPAALTHRVVDEHAREEVGISRGLLRLSVGLEDVRDLWRDLDHALAEVASRLEMREHAEVTAR